MSKETFKVKIKKYPSRYKLCTTIEEIHQVIKWVKQTRICSFDKETDGKEYWQKDSYITMIGISFQPGSTYVIPLGHFESPFKKNWIPILQLLSREIFQNTDIVKIAWNVKFEWRWLFKYGCSMQGVVLDGMLMKYLLDENTRNGLKENVNDLLPEFAGYEDELEVAKKKYGGWDKIPMNILAPYNGIDCDVTLRLVLYFHKKLIKAGFYQLFRNLMMMVCRVLAESEWHGVKIDTELLDQMVEKYDKLIEDKKAELNKNKFVRKFIRNMRKEKIDNLISAVKKEIAQIKKEGKPNAAVLIKNRQNKITRFLNNDFTKKEGYEGLSYSSPPQLKKFLYTSEFGLMFKVPLLTDKGEPSTGEPAIDILVTKTKNPKKLAFLKQLVELRGLEGLQSRNFRGLYKHLDEDGYIHSSYKQLTVTGRLSSVDPNNQNIPRVSTNPDVKLMYIPPKGFLFYEKDYSQAELRIAAELSGDATMIDIFKRDYNIHVATAAVNNGGIEMYERAKSHLKKADEISAHELLLPENKEVRMWVKKKKRGKTVNFGILYGEGPEKLGVEMDMNKKEAEAYIAKWLNNYPGIKKWIKSQHNFVADNGYVMSLWGRKRRLPNIWSDRYREMLEAQRMSVNAPIQSASGDFTTFSSVLIREERLKGKFPAYFIQRITVHDSMDYYILPLDVVWINNATTKICENPDTMTWFGFEMKSVRMKVSSEVGKSWGSLKDFNAWENYSAWVA